MTAIENKGGKNKFRYDVGNSNIRKEIHISNGIFKVKEIQISHTHIYYDEIIISGCNVQTFGTWS
jgi:phage antirepressor YoqD-like protein